VTPRVLLQIADSGDEISYSGGAVAYLPKSEAVSITEFVRNWEADRSPARGIDTSNTQRP